ILAAHPELSCTGKKQDVPRDWGIFEDVLCAGNDKSYTLVEDVLREVTHVFPSRLLHVGGDEVPTTRWSACPKCRALAKTANVSMNELETVFMHRVSTMVSQLGRRMMVWDEALAPDKSGKWGIPRDAIVVAWQSKSRGAEAAKLDHDVIMSPHDWVYFDHLQSPVKGEPGQGRMLTWQKVRAFDPALVELGPPASQHVLGGEGTVWTEYIETKEHIDVKVLPRM